MRLRVSFGMLTGTVENDCKFGEVNDLCDVSGAERGIRGPPE